MKWSSLCDKGFQSSFINEHITVRPTLILLVLVAILQCVLKVFKQFKRSCDLDFRVSIGIHILIAILN